MKRSRSSASAARRATMTDVVPAETDCLHDLRDAAIGHGNVGAEGGLIGAVYYAGVFDDQIVHVRRVLEYLQEQICHTGGSDVKTVVLVQYLQEITWL